VRTLILMRHASVEQWAAGGDFERSLTAAGEREAATAGNALVAGGFIPERVLCSPAARAEASWLTLRKAAAPALDGAVLELLPQLYLGSAGRILDALAALDHAVASVLVVGHNPGLSELSLRLSRRGARQILAQVQRGMKPSTSVVLGVDSSWSGLASAGAEALAVI
jgi:phosphohistidine phosphatase